LTTDNICKYLAEKYPREFVLWLLSIDIPDIQVLKTELSSEPIRADSLILLRIANKILHIEFQTLPISEPPLPLRMLDYWVRLHRKYRCPIVQVVIFLKATNAEAAYQNEFIADNTRHQYQVIRLWEQDPAPLLATPALLPLATLAKTDTPEVLLQQVAAEVAKIETPVEQKSVLACATLLASLRFDEQLINQLFREEIMEESPIYQKIIQKGKQQGLLEGKQQGLKEGRKQGKQQGKQQGRQQGLKEGKQQGRQEGELTLILRQINRRFGTVTPEMRSHLAKLTIPQLEDLGEALFDFTQMADLEAWLAQK
jgi:predicted transposase/invertase (TIGR01784 family)